MQQSIKVLVSIMLGMILYVSIIISMGFTGAQSRKVYRNYERQDIAQGVASELLTLHNIASPDKSYSGSDIVNVISEYGEAYQYIVDINGTEYEVYRDSKDYLTAKRGAQLDLKSGADGEGYELLGDMEKLLDTRLWSASYLIEDIFKDDINEQYGVAYLLEDTVNSVWEDTNKLTGEKLRPEDVVNKVYRIKYTKK